MDFTEFGLDKLIPKVSAQNLDALIQPTFGLLDLGENISSTSSISLSADSLSVQVGKEFEVEVKIDTKSTRISAFEIILDFDTSKLTVIDAEPTVSGTQIEFLDNIFDVDTGGNTVSLSTGRITLKASTASNISYEINNRSVAKIKFQAQDTGTTIIETVSGSSGSKLINSRGTSIVTTLKNLTISSTTSPVDTGTTDGTVVPPTTNSTTGSGTTTGTSTTGTTTLPDTGIEDIAAFLPLVAGVVLLILGISLKNVRRGRDHDA